MKCQKKVVPLIQPIKIGHISETKFEGRIAQAENACVCNPTQPQIENFVYSFAVATNKVRIFYISQHKNYFLLKLPENLVFSKMLLTFVDSMFWML